MIVWQLDARRAAEWRAIRLAALRDAPEAFDASQADWQGRPLADFAARLDEAPTFATGDRLGQPLAVAGWQAGLDPRDPARGWLLSVYARPEARGRGYAETAIRMVLDDAAARGMTSIGLNVRDTALHAQSLYRRLGFEMTARQEVANACGEAEIEMLRALP